MADVHQRSLRRRLRESVLPPWLTMPLVLLGVMFIGLPILPVDWFTYFFFLAAAVAFGVWARFRYRYEVKRPSEGVLVCRVEDRKYYSGTDEP